MLGETMVDIKKKEIYNKKENVEGHVDVSL
jgi:hypothetical protein